MSENEIRWFNKHNFPKAETIKVYHANNLATLLKKMLDYVCENEEYEEYFEEIVNTDLFYDAIGRVIHQTSNYVKITTEK